MIYLSAKKKFPTAENFEQYRAVGNFLFLSWFMPSFQFPG